jgi:hypothetical protein
MFFFYKKKNPICNKIQVKYLVLAKPVGVGDTGEITVGIPFPY